MDDFSALFQDVPGAQPIREYSPEDREVTWGDYGRALGVGALQTASSLAGLSEYATNGAIGGDTRRYLDELAKDQLGKTSLAFQRAASASFLPDGVDDVSAYDVGLGRTIAAKAVMAAPSMVASIIPGGIAARLASGLSTAARIGVASGAAKGAASALNAGDVAGQIYGELEKLPHDKLMESPRYQELIAQGLDQKTARAEFMKDALGVAPIIAGAITYATGGIEGQVGARLGGEAAKGVFKGAVKGAIAEGVQEALESGSGEALTQGQLIFHDLQDDVKWQKILSQTIEGGVVGAAMGGVTGGATNIKVSKPLEHLADDGVSDEQRTALNASQNPIEREKTVPQSPVGPEVKSELTDPTKIGKEGRSSGPEMQAQATPPEAPAPTVEGDTPGARFKAMKEAKAKAAQDAVAGLDEAAARQQERAAPSKEPSAGDVMNDTGITKPEDPNSYGLQIDDMVDPDHARKAVLLPSRPADNKAGYTHVPKDERPPLPKGMLSVPTPDGIYYFNPKKTNIDEIKKLRKAKRTNELFAMADTSKADAADAAARGAEPAVVTVRDGETGVPKVDAITTSETVGKDAQQIADKAAPGDTTEVRTPEAMLVEREAAAPQSEAAKAVTELDQIAARRAAAPKAQAAKAVAKQRMSKKERQAKEEARLKAEMEAGQEALHNSLPGKKKREEARAAAEKAADDMRRGSQRVAQDSARVQEDLSNAASDARATYGLEERQRQKAEMEARHEKERAEREAKQKAEEDERNRFWEQNVTRPMAELNQTLDAIRAEGERGAPKAEASTTSESNSEGPRLLEAEDPYLARMRAEKEAALDKADREAAKGHRGDFENEQKMSEPKARQKFMRDVATELKKGEQAGDWAKEAAAVPKPGSGKAYPKVDLDRLQAAHRKQLQAIAERRAAMPEKVQKAVKKAAKGKKDESRKLSPEFEKELAHIPEADRPTDLDARLAMAKRERAVRIEREAADRLIAGLSETEQARLAELTPEQRAEFARLIRQQGSEARSDEKGIDVTSRGSKGRKGERDLEVTKGIDETAPELHADEERADTRGEDRQEAFDRDAEPDEEHIATNELGEHSAYDLNTKLEAGSEETYAEPEARDRPKLELKEGEGYTVASGVENLQKQPKGSLKDLAPKVEGKIKLSRRLREAVENGMLTLEEALGINPHPTKDEVLKTGSLGDMLSTARGLGVYATIPRGMVLRVVQRIRDVAGKTPVVVVSQETMDRLYPSRPAGTVDAYYDHEQGYIAVSNRFVKGGKVDVSVLAHEGVHAILDLGLSTDKQLFDDVTKIREAAKKLSKQAKAYGFANNYEFLAEALSNPEFQDMLMALQAPTELVRSVGGDRALGTFWDALVESAQRYLANTMRLLKLDRLADAVDRRQLHNFLELAMHAAGRADQSAVNAREAGTKVNLRNAREAGDIVSAAKEYLDFTNPKSTLRAWQRATDTLSMLAQRAERMGGEFGKYARKVDELVQMAESFKDKHLRRAGGALDVTSQGDELRMANPKMFAKAQDIMYEASEMNVNLAKEGEVPNNDHLGKDATKGWQGKGRLDRLLNEFRSLPEEFQDYMLNQVKFYRDERNSQALASIRAVLSSAGIEGNGLAERIFNKKMTDQDREKFKTDSVVSHLNDLANLKKLEGWYVPLLREGEHVASGRMVLDVEENAFTKKVDDNVIQFTDPKGEWSEARARKAAEEFVKGTPLTHISTDGVWVDERDPTKIVPSTDPNAKKAFRVTLQDRVFELHQTEKEALAAVERMKAEGIQDATNDILRDGKIGSWGGLQAAQFETMLSSLERRDNFKKLPEAQREELLQAMREASIRLFPGGRIQHHSLQRRNVAGYNRDLVNGSARYGDMSANYLAKLEYQPKIREAVTDMNDYIDSTRDGLKVRRRELANEMQKRVAASASQDPNTPLGRATKRLLQISMLDKLAGVSFHVINAMEPFVLGTPVLGGRHGFYRSMVALGRSYDLLGAGGALKSGAVDTLAAFNRNSGFTDYLSFFKGNIAKGGMPQERAQRLTDALDYIADRNLFGSEAGMEVRHMTGVSGHTIFRGLDRADMMARQMGTAMEAINRAATVLTAYELEYKKNGGDHAAALKYAHDIVHDTMGNYSSANASPVFNHPLGRLALQFKKYAQKIYFLLGKMVGGMAKGDPEAYKQFFGVLAVQMVFAGALGWPLEPFKLAFLAANTLGVTGFGYDDAEKWVRATIAGMTNPVIGEAITRGLPRALGVDLSGRMSMDSLLTFGQPRSQKDQDLKAWLFDTMAGAPAGFLFDQLKTIKALGTAGSALAAGQYKEAASKAFEASETLVPLKVASDVTKAIRGYGDPKKNMAGREVSEGYNLREAATRALGFTPGREASEGEMRRAVGGEVRQLEENRRKLISDWTSAKPENRARQMIAIEKFNRGLPKDAQISREDLRKAETRRKTEDDTGTVEKGIRFTKRTEHLRKDFGIYTSGR